MVALISAGPETSSYSHLHIQPPCPSAFLLILNSACGCWQVAQAASKVWAQGLRAQALLKTASLEDWSSLEKELHAHLIPYINKVCSDAPQVSTSVY